MYEAFATTFTMLSETAFFSVVCPSVAETHPRMTELTAYAPEAKRKQDMYRATTLSVAHDMINPINAIPMHPVICQVRSLSLPEVMPIMIPNAPETRYGGQVSTRVMVRLNPRLPTTVGKKLLKLHALKCCAIVSKLSLVCWEEVPLRYDLPYSA